MIIIIILPTSKSVGSLIFEFPAHKQSTYLGLRTVHHCASSPTKIGPEAYNNNLQTVKVDSSNVTIYTIIQVFEGLID